MKIAAVSDDGTTISHHFGRAPIYVVVTVEDGNIVSREQREKMGHRQFAQAGHAPTHEHGHHDHSHDHDHDHAHGAEHHTADPRGHGMHAQAHERHQQMASAIADCEAVLARGMGRGAYQGMQASGIRPVITDIAAIDEAVLAYVEGRIVDHTERLH
jgi:predicted Fe-Mo cluster-binding NifX family protein